MSLRQHPNDETLIRLQRQTSLGNEHEVFSPRLDKRFRKHDNLRIFTEVGTLRDLNGSLHSRLPSATNESATPADPFDHPQFWDPERLSSYFISAAEPQGIAGDTIRKATARGISRFVIREKLSGRVFITLSKADFEEMDIGSSWRSAFLTYSSLLHHGMPHDTGKHARIRDIFPEFSSTNGNSHSANDSTRRSSYLGPASAIDTHHSTAQSSPALHIAEASVLTKGESFNYNNIFTPTFRVNISDKSTGLRMSLSSSSNDSPPRQHSSGASQTEHTNGSVMGRDEGMNSQSSTQATLGAGVEHNNYTSSTSTFTSPTSPEALQTPKSTRAPSIKSVHFAMTRHIDTAVQTDDLPDITEELRKQYAAAIDTFRQRLEELEVIVAKMETRGNGDVPEPEGGCTSGAGEGNRPSAFRLVSTPGPASASDSESAYVSSDTDGTQRKSSTRKLGRNAIKGRLKKLRENLLRSETR